MNELDVQLNLATGLISEILQRISELRATLPSTADAVIQAMRAADELVRMAAEHRKAARLAVQQWIEATAIEPVDEDKGVRYYVGQVTKVVQEADNQRAVVMLQTRWPDLAKFSSTLKSSPFKHGYILHNCRELFDAMYRVEIVDDLKTGKPKRELKSNLTGDHHAG